ncbi:sister chromatid cohesion protein DCC1 isoform X2 [Nerophis ophidion]|uniref:sister chromatid cohesion protein DCC1-like isoform X2 n=1 Tax=Nerophis ophidion TaxID=159077 RepID=UPI002ADF19EF|nr:sister chromatid cohesion protein DCC1-like isoform X2 [Nerophis ophidion]XP_061771879.1 sister chromatid cohesion protein DCC1 isoform X2 [Nerophis ophidion]
MRTLEEVQATLEIAKLKEEDLQKSVQCLSFGDSVSSDDYCLMELDDTLCQHIEAGHSLVIRGDKDEHAVLCSGDKTYDLKIAHTSNLLLLLPGCKTHEQLTNSQDSTHVIDANIWGFCSSYWEVRRHRPRLKKLLRVLMENPYEGPAIAGQQENTENTYTMDDLLETIQASEEEIKNHLKTLHACQINGFWRVLDPDYEMKLVGHVTQLVDSESWSFHKVPLQTSLEELGPLEPREMIEHCFNCYGTRYIENGEVFYALDEAKVCRATALMLLNNAVKFNLGEFQEVWQQSVPEGMSTRLDQLKSVALVDRTARPETICLLNVQDLPEDTLERFNHLFTLREKWTEEDITPYIEDLCGEKQTTGALLTKYARSSTQNGTKVFNSRRPIST